MDEDLWHVTRGDEPLLATAIHDGHEVRAEVADLLALDDAGRLREEDPHTGRWTTVAQNRVVARRSRFEVDLNRPPETAVYRTPDDAWGLDVWRAPPSDALVQRSMDVYRGFHDQVGTILGDLQERYGRFVVLDIHSYNHRRDGADAPPADPAGNPVVNVGTGNIDRERWGPLVDRFIAELRDHEVLGVPLDVRENVRFRGGHFSKWVVQTFPETGCPLAVEMKKVYMDEWTGIVDEAAIDQIGEALAATVPGLLASLEGG
jgi:N-formylglutamate amidohydrolase